MSLLSSEEFFSAVEEISGKRLNENQKRAVSFSEKPLKVVAGPGSGKTEVLVLRALYFMAVKGFPARSIFLVSFTRKAASELLTRIVSYAGRLREVYPELPLEPYELYCGTLHSLAARVMEEFQFEDYQRYALMGDFERELFIYRLFKKELSKGFYPDFFSLFKKEDGELLPHQKLSILSFLFDFLTQNLVSIKKIRKKLKEKPENAAALTEAMEAYGKYLRAVRENSLLDHSLLERMFYQFLKSDVGKLFLGGDGTDYFPGIKAVLVDEYQDTNPLDEKIYFALARRSKNLTVVGDDCQALYRFRGAVVECFIDFEKRCRKELGLEPERVELFENYRSDKSIVAFLNYFLKKHREEEGFKDSWKELATRKLVKWFSQIDSYPELEGSVFPLEGGKEAQAQFVADFLKFLKELGVIEDYSDAVLLLPTTRERDYDGNKTLAALVRERLEALGIGVYNPRSKAFKERREVYLPVGALSLLLPRPARLELPQVVEIWEREAEEFFPEGLLNSLKEMALSGEAGLLELFYRLIPRLEPCGEFEKFNLGRLSQLLFAVEGLSRKEVDGAEDLEKRLKELSGEIPARPSRPEGVEREKWLRLTVTRLHSFLEFYRSFLPLLALGSADQEELPRVPPGHFPLMTIHQSKGLEFPVVMVGELDRAPSNRRLAGLEKLFSSLLPYRISRSWERNAVDAAKQFFVAYSRAIYALIILSDGKVSEEDLEKRPWKAAGYPAFKPEELRIFREKFRRKVEDESRGDSPQT